MSRRETHYILIILLLVTLSEVSVAIFLPNYQKLHINCPGFYTGKVEVFKPDKKVEPDNIRGKLFLSNCIKTCETSKAYIHSGNDLIVEFSPNNEPEMNKTAFN